MNPFCEVAREYAAVGWEVVPLRGKIPAIPKRAGGCGVLDATSDIDQIDAWCREFGSANIGARVPEGVIVIDVDPRHGGLDDPRVDELRTLTAWSGRGDGGRHCYFKHPGGAITAKRLPPGWDLRTHANYVVLPPSIHPETGGLYRWADEPARIAAAPEWLVELLRPVVVARARARTRATYTGDSIADWFTETCSWHDVLVGWTCVGGDGDADGSAWRHPTATARVSATVRHEKLFVYTTNTALEPTGAGDPHGYTKFRAWAELEHGGDLSAAARAARARRKASV
jgi:hypothetical protein